MRIEKRLKLISLQVISILILAGGVFYFIIFQRLDGANAIIVSFIGFAVLLTIAISIMNWYVSKNVLQPLREIYKGSSSLIAGEDLKDKIAIKTGDELDEIADNFNKMASVLQTRIDMLKTASEKEQAIIRSLTMLNEMMGFITSELKIETILQAFLEMIRHLLKAEHSGIFIFEDEQRELKLFRTTIEGQANVSLSCAMAMIQSPLGDGIRTLTPSNINGFPGILPLDHLIIKNLITLPLTSTDKKMSALLIVVNKDSGFTHDDEDTLFNFAVQAFHALTIHEEIAHRAITDGLTGLSNHKSFQEKLTEEMTRAERYSNMLSLIMFDIDHFKSFNDIYGHQTGDKVLKEIAKIISKNIRSIDFPARYGGEEFMLILPETGCEDAVVIAERIRLKVIGHPFTTESGEAVRLTVSAGVACYPTDAMQKKDLIKNVDQSLYFAKNSGRNKVCTYQEMVTGALKEVPEELDDILSDPNFKGIEAIANGIDAKSIYTKNHSIEVAAYAVLLGKHIKLDEEQVESLRIASILHDIGNIAIPDHILNKPGSLTPEEKSIIQGHPGLAEMVLKKYPRIEDILPAILYHHERFDGKGYPNGLKAEEIPLLARILSVVEAYQAMVSPRPYRRRMTREEAIERLKKDAGVQFDPMVVNAFITLLQKKEDENPQS